MDNLKFVGEGRKMKSFVKGSFVLSLLLLFLIFSQPASAQYNQKNVSVKVNVTNAGPEILSIYTLNPIPLNAGSVTTVYCNATVRDYNGFNDVNTVNATFHFIRNSSGPDDNNTHYSMTNCTRLNDDGEFLVNYTCEFNVSYIAYNGTWYCNITANDSKEYFGYGVRAVNISALYALNVTDVIDYGNLSVTDYSENKTAEVTNLGNMNMNVSVLGYGQTQGDGLGFVCTQGTNISVQYQRFSGNVSADWATKRPLATTNADVGVTLPRPEDENTPVTATTYWQLYVPPNPFGLCTGTVRFTATSPGA